MAAAVQPARVPIEIYLKSSYEPDAEYVDGMIEERPAALWDHANWHGAVDQYFGSRRHEFGIRVRPSLRIRTGANTIRVPDVAILGRNLPVEQIVTHPPIAVFEILSPEDSLNRMMAKLADYERMGIKTILVLDPNGQHFRYLDGTLEPLPPNPFDIPGSAGRFDLAEIEKLLD